MITVTEWNDGVVECWSIDLMAQWTFITPSLHYPIPEIGAPGRTRTDEYEVYETRPVLLRHRAVRNAKCRM